MNIILILVDGLRADHLGCYGYGKPTSPMIDSIAQAGAMFESFFTSVTPTQPSVTTILTGQFPSTHRIIAQSGHHTLSRKAPWLPETLRKNGFATAAIDSLASEKRWFSRGFDTIMDSRKVFGDGGDAFRINSLAVGWIKRQRRSRPFFLTIHYYDTHTPYTNAERYLSQFYDRDPTLENRGSLDTFYRMPLKPDLITEWAMRYLGPNSHFAGEKLEDIEFIRSLYDASIRTVDDGISQLVESLRAMRMLEDTVLIIMADHGQELGEHGIYFDQHGLYDSTIRIPLILNGGGQIPAGRRVGSMQQTTDIAPTVLELAGCRPLRSHEGHSLLPRLRDSHAMGGYHYVLAAESTWMAKWAYRTDRHKLIVAREPDIYGKPSMELYDLVSDPAEQNNIAPVQGSLCHSMREQLEAAIALRGSDTVADHGIVRSIYSYHVTKSRRNFQRPVLSGLIHELQRITGRGGIVDPKTDWDDFRELRYPDFKAALDELAPGVGANEWRLAVLRKEAGRTGVFPVRLYGVLRRLSRRSPPRPYFVGLSSDGILFLGDFRDSYSVASAVVPGYNQSVTTLLIQAARNNPSSFVDVGANLGIVAAAVARELRGIANVYALEPHPETAQRAAATFALNHLTNIRLYQCAVDAEDGRGVLHFVPGGSALASLTRTQLHEKHRRVVTHSVVTRTLDSMNREFQWDRIGLMKIDVEGNEHRVLAGAGELIRTLKPSILCEANPLTQVNGPDRSFSADYAFEVLGENGKLCGPESDGTDLWCTPISQ